ncbi:MAG TPA: nucleotidyltransferase family protein, partial [Clostridiaceae bacterium]|nr:nucleotidyltransferase family protein [Clostridiaceae bacterium]
MKMIGFVAEYNPLHNGHIHQIAQVKQRYGNRLGLIAVMSGDWTQRAGLAILDKWERARLATQAGISLIIELPTVFATGNAPCFAKGAVELLTATGLIKQICCGAETDQPKYLHQVADLMESEPPALSRHLQEALKQGLNAGAAWEQALKAYLSTANPAVTKDTSELKKRLNFTEQMNLEKQSNSRQQAPLVNQSDKGQEMSSDDTLPDDLLRGSNNWLALEYIKAARRLGNSGPHVTVLPRQGQPYLDTTAHTETDLDYPSGTAIREKLYQLFGSRLSQTNVSSKRPPFNEKMWLQLCRGLPDSTAATLLRTGLNRHLGFNEQMGPHLLCSLLAQPKQSLEKLAGFSPDFTNRSVANARELNDIEPVEIWSSFIEKSRSRNFTIAYVVRALTALALGITDEQRKRAMTVGPQYIRVLAFDKTGRYLLRRMRESATLPVITRESDFLEYNGLGQNFTEQYELDMKAVRIRRLMLGQGPGNNFD